MASSNSFISLLAQLKELEKSKDYSNIIDTFNSKFDSDANKIIEKWTSNETLSNDEKKYIDSYSNIQLSYVKYCSFGSNTIADIQTLIGKLPVLLFQRKQLEILADAVIFIREQQSTSTEDDYMLICIIRMIDTRSLAYRLCFKSIRMPTTALNDELEECLLFREAKNYLHGVKSNNDTNRDTVIDIRHQFFIGCCTFAVALYEDNKGKLTDNDKYVYLLAKYIRVMLNKKDFKDNGAIHYCLRGIFALLTNYIPHDYWLNIMNNGLGNEADEDAQKKNPFNLDLFSLIINRLLASNTLQKKTEESNLNDETLLLDAVLVFLVKWSDTPQDLIDEEEEKSSSTSEQPNQLLHCLQSHQEFQQTAQILVPYIDAKYDRIRLMAISILSNIMHHQDFKDLENKKPHMAKDLVKLLFDFINQAEKQSGHSYKGIAFYTLLHSLLRFLVQDFIKKETLPYISQIVHYAKKQDIYPLKILFKISTNPGLREDLSKNVDLKTFLDTDADLIYGANSTMSTIVKYIRQNLAPPVRPPSAKKGKSSVSDQTKDPQAFISYCHDDTAKCKILKEKLDQNRIFKKVWIDKEYMRDKMIDTVAKAISDSKIVFILLSDSYCQSDFCRMEWTYAINEGIQIYVVIVQEDFKKSKYDWVRFSFAGRLYYKMYNDDDFQNLIVHVTEFLNVKLESDEKTAQPTSQPPSSPLPPPVEPKPQTTNQKYLEKSISTWTTNDVQNWCTDKKLEKWSKLLANYDGQNLLTLRKDLSKDSNIQYVVKGNSLDGIDVARFKSEIDKLSPRTVTKNESLVSPSASLDATKEKSPTKKQPKPRRTSKSTNK